MAAKPDSLEQYIIAYCNAKIHGDPVPITVEGSKLSYQSMKYNGRNSVNNPSNVLIKMRAIRSTKEHKTILDNVDVEFHSDGEYVEPEPGDGEDQGAISDTASDISSDHSIQRIPGDGSVYNCNFCECQC